MLSGPSRGPPLRRQHAIIYLKYRMRNALPWFTPWISMDMVFPFCLRSIAWLMLGCDFVSQPPCRATEKPLLSSLGANETRGDSLPGHITCDG